MNKETIAIRVIMPIEIHNEFKRLASREKISMAKLVSASLSVMTHNINNKRELLHELREGIGLLPMKSMPSRKVIGETLPIHIINKSVDNIKRLLLQVTTIEASERISSILKDEFSNYVISESSVYLLSSFFGSFVAFEI